MEFSVFNYGKSDDLIKQFDRHWCHVMGTDDAH